MCETTDKPAEEVQRYYDVFWARGPEHLTEWRRVEEKIAKAHERIARLRVTEALIRDLVSKEDDPFRTLAIPYGPSTKASYLKGFTEEEDRFLICMINVLGAWRCRPARLASLRTPCRPSAGWGSWDTMKAEIRRSPQFRLNWFMLSRTAADLQRRCETLVRL